MGTDSLKLPFTSNYLFHFNYYNLVGFSTELCQRMSNPDVLFTGHKSISH